MITETLNGRTVAEYTWGYLDKVIEVKCNGKVTRFDYDAQGMPVGKQLSTCRQAWPDGTYERWVWDGMALIARGDEYSINEPPITGGLPIVSKTKEGVRYHQYDPLGTTLASYTADGKLAATYKATAFGKGELQNSPAARFTGKPYEADLGAYVFPFRNYKPELARWMSADPSGFPDGPNNHFYAPVPTMGVDPLGLWQSGDTFSADWTHRQRRSIINIDAGSQLLGATIGAGIGGGVSIVTAGTGSVVLPLSVSLLGGLIGGVLSPGDIPLSNWEEVGNWPQPNPPDEGTWDSTGEKDIGVTPLGREKQTSAYFTVYLEYREVVTKLTWTER